MRRWVRLIGLSAGFGCGPDLPEGATDSVPTEASSGGVTDPSDVPTAGVPSACGDGVVDGDELCDDGNGAPGDGCDQCVAPLREEWSVVFDGPEHRYDHGNAVAFTPAGQVYVAGSQGGGSGHESDLVLRKLNVDGTLLWERLVEGPALESDWAHGVAVTADDGVVVVGEVGGVGDILASDPWARRYTAAGDEVWTFWEPAPAPAGIATLADVELTGDAALVTGWEEIGGDLQIVVRRLELATGVEVWRRQYAHKSRAIAEATTLLNGDLIVAGERETDEPRVEAVIQRWRADGTLVSTWTWSSPTGAYSQALAVGAQSDGTIVAAIHVRTADNGFENSYLVAFASDGTPRWVTPIATDYQVPYLPCLTVDGAGRTFVAGDGKAPSGRTEALIGVFGASGAPLLTQQLGGDEILSLLGGIDVRPTGVVVTGELCTHTTCDQWVRKLALP